MLYLLFVLACTTLVSVSTTHLVSDLYPSIARLQAQGVYNSWKSPGI